MHNGSRSLSISQDFSVAIADGGRLFQLQGQSLTGFKGIMHPRHEITTFSRRSRWELQKTMAVINEAHAGLPDFLTLTYPKEWSQDWHVWKRDLKAFREALQRRWPDVWGVWRLEFQERGAPHFHCLLWDGPGLEGITVKMVGGCENGKLKVVPIPGSERNQEIYTWLSETWFRICKTGDPKHLNAGTRIEPIQSWNGVVSYASKYLAKLPDGSFTPVAYTGRFWGRFQAAKWKTCVYEKSVSEAEFYMLRRVLRKKRERAIGKKKYMEPGEGITDISLKELTGCKLLVWAYQEAIQRGSENSHAPF